MAFARYVNLCGCNIQRAVDEEPDLKNLLPDGYTYALCNFDRDDKNFFTARFRINVNTKEGIKTWLEDFKKSSKTWYRISRTFPEDSSLLIYKVYMHCYRNTLPTSHKVKTPTRRHTGCSAQLSLTVKKTKFTRKYRSKDVHLPELPTIIILKHHHNHKLDLADPRRVPKPNGNKMTLNSSSFFSTILSITNENPTASGILNSDSEESSEGQSTLSDFEMENVSDQSSSVDASYASSYIYTIDDSSVNTYDESAVNTNDDSSSVFNNDESAVNSNDNSFSIFINDESTVSTNDGSSVTTNDESSCTITNYESSLDAKCEKWLKANATKNNSSNNVISRYTKRVIISKLEDTFLSIKEKAEKSIADLAAVEEFIASYENNIHTEDKLVSALNAFGKFTSVIENKSVIPFKKVNVQTTPLTEINLPVGDYLYVQADQSLKCNFEPEDEHINENTKSSKKVSLVPCKLFKVSLNGNNLDVLESVDT